MTRFSGSQPYEGAKHELQIFAYRLAILAGAALTVGGVTLEISHPHPDAAVDQPALMIEAGLGLLAAAKYVDLPKGPQPDDISAAPNSDNNVVVVSFGSEDTII